MLGERLGLSERRACRITGQHRSMQRHRPRRIDRDDAVRARLRELAREHPRWGYRRAWASLRGEGWQLNRKKIQRIWREEGLRVPAKRRKRQRLGTSTTTAARLRAQRPDHVRALDFQFDSTLDGRVLKLLHVVDEHTREALTIEVDRRIDADHTVRVLERIVVGRGRPPELLRMDNGPELTANALRDWCRFGGSGSAYIEPGSPGRTPSWNPSAPASAMRSSPSRRSTRCSRQEPSSRNGETPTTQSDRTAASAGQPRPPTLRAGGTTDNPTLITSGPPREVRPRLPPRRAPRLPPTPTGSACAK